LDDVTTGPDGIAMEVSATAYSHLYTYNFEDTRSQPVDFALLFLHMVLVIAHHLILVGQSRSGGDNTYTTRKAHANQDQQVPNMPALN
jgi:hypothetical protein